MKQYFGLMQSVYNGTALMQQVTTSYTTAELRETVKQYLENQNSTLPDGWTAEYREFDAVVYEHTKEVPILQNSK